MEILRDVKVMQSTSRAYVSAGKTIGFVPTMGALHNGHLSLVKRARAENDVVVVSIFVNPIQFLSNEDFDKYPQSFKADSDMLRQASVDVLFFPDAHTMYPENFNTYVEVRGITDLLCGAHRPGHFTGVATIVLKLFNTVMPARAYFGLKDYQQCLVINRMVTDLNLNVDIIMCHTIREEDGLAMSSRNRYLTPGERKDGALINQAMKAAEEALIHNKISFQEVPAKLRETLNSGTSITEIQYASVYDPKTLRDLSQTTDDQTVRRTVLIAVALKIGDTRLIDNLLVHFDSQPFSQV